MEKPGTTDLEDGHILVGLLLILGGITTDAVCGTGTSYSLLCTSLNLCLFSIS